MTFNGKKVLIISQPPPLSIEKKGTLVGVTNRYKKKEKVGKIRGDWSKVITIIIRKLSLEIQLVAKCSAYPDLISQ